MFSNAFNPGAVNGTNFRQVIDWTNFMGGNRFCIKVCDPSYALAPRMCEYVPSASPLLARILMISLQTHLRSNRLRLQHARRVPQQHLPLVSR